MSHSRAVAVETHAVSKAFAGDQPAVDQLDLTVYEGEIVVLLGPSGCGKTTSLRLIAGFERPDAGQITIQGRTVADARSFTPPERRGVGMVFQEYALFPHLTVLDNVAFGLHNQPREQQVETAQSMLHLVGLPALAQRYPHELSGGQRQRIALARALAPRPYLVLLDEPFSNLDADLRALMREEVRVILKGIQATAIFVTHDQEEAMYLGDRIAVMNNGRLEQIDRAERLFHQPETRFVAEFLGESDFLPGVVSKDGIETEIGRWPQRVALPVGSAVEIALRPDDLRFEVDGEGNGLVLARQFKGAHHRFRLRLPSGRLLHAAKHHLSDVRPGNRVRIELDPGHDLPVFAGDRRVSPPLGEGD